jgi:predicted Zn-dependent protease
MQTYVNQLGRWLSLEAPQPDLPWTFAVLDGADAQLQAFPSAHVFISHTLVRKLNTEAELAGLLALGIAQTAMARSQATPSAADTNSTAASDHLAVVLLARAGFNPAVLIDALRLTSANGAGTTFISALLGDDAAVQLRIKGLRQFMGTRFEDYRRKPSPSLSQRLASLAASTAQ